MPATSIKSSWSSGSLIFHEKTSYAPSTTYNVLTLGTGAVKVGDTANDVDFQYYGTGSLSWIIDCGAATLTNTGIAMVQKAALTVGVSGAGYDVTFYGDTAGCDFLWDQNGDTDGSLILGADTKGVDFKAFGTTTGNYLIWDKSADDLLLVGTATQLAVAGTTESTSTTTGSLRTAGGLACVGDFYAGDDIFLTSGAVLNWNAGDVTITHSANTLAFAGGTSYTLDGLTTVTVASLNATTGRIAKFDGTVLTPNFGDGYGAIECNLNIGTGAVPGFVAVGSYWANLGAGTTFSAGGTVSPLDVGIWCPTGATLTNSKMIMGLKMSCVIDDGANPGSLYLFYTNIFDNATTALFDVNTIVDFSATASAASSGAYKLPFLKERSTGTTWYMNIYTS